MPWPSSDLFLMGLGIRHDAPPVADQPPLADGVHLRWGLPRAAGFPWHGFYLFRRPSSDRVEMRCLSPILDRGTLAASSSVVETAAGTLSGSAPLRAIDDFPAAGLLEIDLADQEWVRLDRSAERPMRGIRATIGFRDTELKWRCVEFGRLADLVEMPLEWSGLTIRSAADRQPVDRAAISRGASGLAVLVVSGAIDMVFDEPTDVARIEFDGADQTATVEAFDRSDRSLGQAVARRGVALLRGTGMARLRLIPHVQIARIARICLAPRPMDKGARIVVEALDRPPGHAAEDSVVVASREVEGAAGEIVGVELPVSRATGIRVSGGPAALLDLCWAEPERALRGEWEPVPHCPQPIALPIRHPDYPAWSGPIDEVVAEQEALSRIRYGSAAEWQGAPFAEMHEALRLLVEGGPAMPMSDPARAWTDVTPAGAPAGVETPRVSRLHPLDMLMLGAIHAPVAEQAGLAWTDETTGNQSFDYMVVADHAGVSGGHPGRLIEHIMEQGFDAGTDVAILYDQRAEPRQPLPAPVAVKVHALPGGPVRDEAGHIRQAAGAAGLDWPVAPSPSGWLDAAAPVYHHVYRDFAGNGAVAVMPPEARDWRTKGRPVVRAASAALPTAPAAAPAGWPPTEPAYVDLALDEEWYVYQMVGVDIFGRFSPKSAFAAWWQWAPAPNPPPWYQSGTTARVVDPQAVRILDKTPPPVPLSVEAFVLDPADPVLVKDAAYQAWRASLGADGADRIGLRVRWRWGLNQQLAAPDTAEFRLYWHGGSAPPPGWEDAAAWADRFFVNPYDANVQVGPDGDRRYDVFLPKPGSGALATSVPLHPDVATPVAYANVSATASDGASHSADRWPGSGANAARVGNEGRCAPPQRVFRVHRTPPPAPGPVVDGPRVYATPADWHGRSFHTHRWVPQPGLHAHVLRAIDEAVFEADWVAQPRPAIAPSDPAFPTEAIWTAAKKAAVAARIDAIGALLPNAPDASQKAAAKPAAFALYRALNDDALRVLGNRTGNERAFQQVSVAPLAADDAPDRRGPDDPADYLPSADRCAFVDSVEGRARNRLLYRTQFIDAAQNRSPFGPCATPVRLPDVVAPRPPAVTRAIGGDRTIALHWRSGAETDLAAYRIYRAADERAARGVETMAMVADIAVAPDPAARPAEMTWTDTDVPGLRDFWYRIVAVDAVDPDPRGGGGNPSTPSPAIRVRAFDQTPPPPPPITAVDRVWIDAAGMTYPFTDPAPDGAPGIAVQWEDAGVDARILVQARGPADDSFRNLSGWLTGGVTTFASPLPRPFEPVQLRLKVVNGAGNANDVFLPVTLPPA